MHIADVAVGYLGANGVLTAGLPLACGVGALGEACGGTDQVCVAFFGDGAANRGPFHESREPGGRVAAARDLRLREQLVGLDDGLRRRRPPAARSPPAPPATASRATTVDGNDVLAVHDEVAAAVERARRGRRP